MPDNRLPTNQSQLDIIQAIDDVKTAINNLNFILDAQNIAYDSNTSVKDKIDDVQETADSKSNLVTETLLANHYIPTASTWEGVNLTGNIDDYEYLGFSFASADKTPTQGIIKAIIPVSTFKTSDTNSPIAIIEDYYNPLDSRALFVCFYSTTSILRYRGSDVYMYHRLSVFGIGKKS